MKVHFIGIGGIGVSALAKYYLAKGHEVSGCDLVSSETTDQLKKMGVKIRIGKPDAACPAGAEKIIYSPAVQKDSLKIESASWRRKLKIPTLSYPQALGELTKKHFTIAVAGTHGKSTTTAMIGLLLTKAGFDPTVIMGTKLKEFGDSNCRVGKSKYLVIEADEHFASFLNYRPQLAVLTSVEADHLDYYKNLKNLLKAFRTFVSHAPLIVGNKDDKNIRNILKGKTGVTWFSLKEQRAEKLRGILQVPGEHNVANALAALATSTTLCIPKRVGLSVLSQYRGSWRRFEIFPAFVKTSAGKRLPYTLVSDYGHHPTEIAATVQAARAKWPTFAKASAGKPKKKIWLVFQPHQYARTYFLWNDFVKVLSHLPVDKLILTDIYDVAGRENEQIEKRVSSKKLAETIKNSVLYISTLKEVERYLRKNLRGGEAVIVMGAGNIYERLTLRLTRERRKEKMNS
ncbi:MAG: UDP-N-acetylmuramate--L-alanine ligase [Parcubacteria group bacterium]|nr:UDP-N-acetylmuramate--L-alanine ligase [Parcubacteria group bacterium]